ncbi:acetyltransferase [Tersicoccus phoenicis]|uniref:Acetyltransferase n=1 Tax=Tersicoccus phoenicis TaxID=554083 RepID=A0A1R1L8K9_9MICC|nr:NeuD/PglB/VioB family sugar acetyltransferase [Tersicoccus phoenicis]OMH23854.1 acetyltransferase [Tersicoccus phoenicis]
MENLILVAASGLARETAVALRGSTRYRVRGYLDDDVALAGTSVDDLPVLGPIDAAASYGDCSFVVCVGKGVVRAAIVRRLAGLGVGPDRYGTVIAASVVVPGGCTVGVGSILLTGTVLTAAVTLGRHVVAMPHVVFTHDDEVGDYATFAAGVTLGGGVVVGPEAYVGMNAGVRERTRVGAGAVIGMGAVVLDDVPNGQTWAGVPARPIGVEKAVPAATNRGVTA